VDIDIKTADDVAAALDARRPVVSLAANTALVVANASLAAEVAHAVSSR